MRATFTLILFCLCIRVSAQVDTLHVDSAKIAHSALIGADFNKDKRWHIGAFAGIGYAYRAIRSERYKELKACRDGHETGLVAPELAVRVGYELNAHLRLVTGVHYYQGGFELNESLQLSDTLVYEMGAGCDVYNVVHPERGYVTVGFHDPRFGYSIQGYHPASGTLQVRAKYHYIKVPLLVQFTAGKKRWKSSVSAGAGLSYLAAWKLNTTVTGNTAMEPIELAQFRQATLKDWGYNRWNIAAIAEAGLMYVLSSENTLGFTAGGRMHLLNLFKEEFWQPEVYGEHHFNIYAALSFTHRL